MTNGRNHAIIGEISCFIGWMVISTFHFFWSGLFLSLTFGAILAKFPDIDLDIRVFGGHRSIVTHSAIIPGIVLLAAIFLKEFAFLSIVIYWNIAQGSHLISDVRGRQPTGMERIIGKLFLFLNGIVLITAGMLAGVYVLA